MKELGEAKKRLAEIEAKYGTDIDLAGLKKQLDVKDGELRSAGERESQLNQVLFLSSLDASKYLIILFSIPAT